MYKIFFFLVPWFLVANAGIIKPYWPHTATVVTPRGTYVVEMKVDPWHPDRHYYEYETPDRTTQYVFGKSKLNTFYYTNMFIKATPSYIAPGQNIYHTTNKIDEKDYDIHPASTEVPKRTTHKIVNENGDKTYSITTAIPKCTTHKMDEKDHGTFPRTTEVPKYETSTVNKKGLRTFFSTTELPKPTTNNLHGKWFKTFLKPTNVNRFSEKEYEDRIVFPNTEDFNYKNHLENKTSWEFAAKKSQSTTPSSSEIMPAGEEDYGEFTTEFTTETVDVGYRVDLPSAIVASLLG